MPLEACPLEPLGHPPGIRIHELVGDREPVHGKAAELPPIVAEPAAEVVSRLRVEGAVRLGLRLRCGRRRRRGRLRCGRFTRPSVVVWPRVVLAGDAVVVPVEALQADWILAIGGLGGGLRGKVAARDPQQIELLCTYTRREHPEPDEERHDQQATH